MAESRHDLEHSDDPIRDGVRAVAIALADAKRMLLEKAEEMGVDLESMIGDPELADNIERRRAAADDNDVVRLAKSYALEARSVLKTSLEWNRGENDPIAAEMLEILDWYVFFIAAKVHRGYHGIANLDGTEEIEELLDSQSDANGSIKVGLIAIERSILAWTYLLSTDNINVVRPQIERLEKIRSLIETKFPTARDFVRPGFDEIETVM
ncbi:MAG: hypothetical protein KA746_11065 [Pyrinomonadaceae bacterium]|nr:hypothetical protein [Pyrinomonadaceae bacterium]MBP6212648.1 hypothetical protein [Pyrinomonadaceae bacterium]